MNEKDRLTTLAAIIRKERVRNQEDLRDRLLENGFETTQSSISRDLKKLGIVKVDGCYKSPNIAPGESNKVDRLDAIAAGDNLIILKTGPGNANRAGVLIDKTQIPGILGTIAGDDTIFVAVSNRNVQSRVLKKIFSLFD
ncbi:MAG: hypothetical protein HRU19_08840 [Pseudobacteriovorax sp.]|nr:hypothetical protein [Pseudobacteriovorax sp.]